MSTSRAGLTGLCLVGGLLIASVRDTGAQESRPLHDCPAEANPRVEAGWGAYRAGELEAAGSLFADALARCPDHSDALTGAGYVNLRRGELEAAESLFIRALQRLPEQVDARVGLGLVAWRRGALGEARTRFRAVLDFDPQNRTVHDFLARIPEEPEPPPPAERSDTLRWTARVRDSRFEVRSEAEWRPFYVRGVNLGAALPGRFPSQFPDERTYKTWLERMAEMGVNAVRLYTIHPPGFYRALARHNGRHPETPLRLVQGVWTEPPPEGDFDDPEWREGFLAEIARAVDAVHGRARIPTRPGHASGSYEADVSDWTLAWVLGREWEPHTIEAYEARIHGPVAHRGRYLRTVEEARPMEAWLAGIADALVAYEMDTYHAQRPVAFTSWPTLDPLRHVTETTTKEAWEIARSLGEAVGPRPPRFDFDDDAVSVDPGAIHPTSRFPAGWFAAYHAYPYYPDFLVLDPKYGEASSPFGRSNYFGYLRELKRHHGDLAVLIAEYGVPASLGIAHLQPQGWHHGGHSETEMAAIDARLTREIAAAGMAGGILFAWIDEWFKLNWLVQPFTIPRDRSRVWWNRLDPEQHYGVIAMEPVPAVAGGDMAKRGEAWLASVPLYDGDLTVRAAADPAHLWIRVQGTEPLQELRLGLDVAGAAELEFQLVASPEGARLWAAPCVHPFRLDSVPERIPSPAGYVEPAIDGAPPGFFRLRGNARYNVSCDADPSGSRSGPDRVPLRVVTNRRRLARDSTEYGAMGYDRGILPGGAPPDGYWEWSADRTEWEVRIPWMLLNVTDPSQRRVLSLGVDRSTAGSAGGTDPFRTQVTEGIRVHVRARSGYGEWLQRPVPGRSAALFRWEKWEEPRWRQRARPVFETLRSVYRELEVEG